MVQLLKSLARNLVQLREQRGLTISGLSQRCGIAKSTLSSLESAYENPSIEMLWSIANALDAPFGRLISGDGLELMHIGDENAVVRFIEQGHGDSGALIESYRLGLSDGYTKKSAAHPLGVREKVVVTNGIMMVGDLFAPRVINAGEVHSFFADVPHVYRALGKSAQAIVFVEYPAPKTDYNLGLAGTIEWPSTALEWEGIASVLERMRLEVSNGLSALMLRFKGCALPIEEAIELLRCHLNVENPDSFRWPHSVVLEADQEGPYVMFLPRHFTQAFCGLDLEAEKSPLWRRALELARRAEMDLISEDIHVEADIASDHRVLQSLGAECALKAGLPLLPKLLQFSSQPRISAVAPSTDACAFSSRIQVEHYDAFELLHPAYARQAVAMAQDITDFTQSRHTVDVGTGPGIPLLMLQELLPNLLALAVEPDPVAYACLERNVSGNAGISLHQGGFLELEMAAKCDLITSVGASHHFNTAFMLQKSWNLLKPGGIFSVADEFLPSFNDAETRCLSLVRHHSAYIIDVISDLDRCKAPIPVKKDYAVYRAFRHYLAQAILMAGKNEALQAVRLCRQLFAEVRQASMDERPKTAVGAYVQFFWLELQAMVAGFDYEVECKTHTSRFLELAAGTGFELLRHRRVFATWGDQAHGGGTHVMTFRKGFL